MDGDESLTHNAPDSDLVTVVRAGDRITVDHNVRGDLYIGVDRSGLPYARIFVDRDTGAVVDVFHYRFAPDPVELPERPTQSAAAPDAGRGGDGPRPGGGGERRG